MTIEDNLYEKSIKILTDLIAFKTVSGQDNSELINYCEKILKLKYLVYINERI